MNIYARALRYFRPFLWPTLGGVLLTFAAIAFNLLKPWPFKYIVDGVLDPTKGASSAGAFVHQWFGDNNPAGAVLGLSLVMVAISLLAGLVNMASNYLFIRVGLRALLQLRTDLYATLQSLPLKFHDSRRSADSSFRVAYDSQSIQTIYNKGFATILSSVVMLIAALVVMFRMNWPLTLTSLIILPFVVLAIRFYAERVRKQSTTIQERESDLLTLAQEGLSQIRLVHAFGREAFEVRQFRRRAAQSLEANMRLNMTSVASALVVGTLMSVGTALMYYVGSIQVLKTGGAFTLGDLLVFASYLLMLYQPLEQLTYTAWALEGAAAGTARCFEVLDRDNDVPDAPDAKAIGSVNGRIEFRGVSFGYTEGRMILKDAGFPVEPGQTVAFVGGTGTGKSTLLSLVPRFYDPGTGAVSLDGNDLRSLTKKSLRSQIGMVLQDTLLFSTTIKENIAYGKPGATDGEIIEAARRAQAYDFIMQMPQGFESPVGERGGHLSVGQRQRIGIARAFLKDAPILLLDEPTSALDPTTEHAIMGTISELMRGRTTLIVTHRLATVHAIGRIIVLKEGRIVEDGTGPGLVAKGGIYAALYRDAQAG
ncbi:MAG: ABC transporter ATP-binding protein/permease [Terrimicrobiaceae bacterium]|nr:ABC transporter ATP-binding protein/permease [Terrimicrobiaceae bacterium]